MKTKKLISSVAACLFLCGAAFSVHAIEAENFPQEAASVSYDSPELADYAEQVAVLVNKERAANGLQPVRFSPKLSEAANIRSGELKQNFSHTRPDGTSCFTAMDELGITYRAAAENIAYGQRSPESVMNAWMNSSGHRANILNKNMEYIGVGVVYRDGVYYWTQLFASSDSLSEGAYLPGGDTVTTTTTTEPALSTQITTTTRLTTETSTTTKSETTQITTNAVTTTAPEAVQTTTAPAVTTTDLPITTTQSTTCQPTTTAQTTTTCTLPEADGSPIIITKPVFTLPSSGDCTIIGGGAAIVIYPE